MPQKSDFQNPGSTKLFGSAKSALSSFSANFRLESPRMEPQNSTIDSQGAWNAQNALINVTVPCKLTANTQLGRG